MSWEGVAHAGVGMYDRLPCFPGISLTLKQVKCDQKRPACRTCRALGVACEGFSNQVRWMRDEDNETVENGRRGTRRHLYTGMISEGC